MKRFPGLPILNFKSAIIALAAALVLSPIGGIAFAQEDPGWPREYARGEAMVVLHQPQVESWADYLKLKVRLAVSVQANPGTQPIFGTVLLEVWTNTDFETRSVMLIGIDKLEIHIPGENPNLEQEVSALIESVIREAGHAISLDRILANLSKSPTANRTDGINLDPPPIFFSDEPAILVIFDGKPVFRPIDDVDMATAVNTNWDIFRNKDESAYYIRDGDTWYETKDLFGKWRPASAAPKSLGKLPADDNWREVKASLPGRKISKDEMPRVFVSQQPAELITTEGPAELSTIAGTGLLYITNTTNDLFQFTDDQQYYLLISGRWFRSPAPAGPWSAATGELPPDFQLIHPDHEMAHVLVSVPGTPEAEEAAIQAQIPQQADVKRDEATVAVTYNGEPEFEPIEDTEMMRAINTTSDVIMVEKSYYCCHEGVWFVAGTPNGAWIVCDTIPAAIYTIPASSPVHRVTYVHVYSSTPTTVVYGYTGGYMGMYVWGGCVVYGSGYYWPPYVYYPHYGYPVYYPHGHYSYGCGAWYNPHTGTYARGGASYGPYGGVGRSAAYNPHTGTYARSASAWGPSGGTWGAEAWNPRTGGQVRTRQSVDPYKQWGSSVATRGGEGIRTGHVTGDDGRIAGFETSKGGRGFSVRGEDGQGGFAARSGDGDLYAGRNGEVYRHGEEGWQKREDGGWQEMERGGQGLSDEQRQQAQERTGQGRSEEQRQQARERDGQGVSDDQRRQAQERANRDRSERDRSQRERQQLERDRKSRVEGDRRSRENSQRSRSQSSRSRSRSAPRRSGGRRR